MLAELLAKWFGVQRDPARGVWVTGDVELLAPDGGPPAPVDPGTNYGPVPVVSEYPLATIARPSRSWTVNAVAIAASSQGRVVQLANRNLYRTSLRVILAPDSGTGFCAIRVAPAQELAPVGAVLSASGTGVAPGTGSVELELRSVGEVWAYVLSGEGMTVSVVSEFEDGSAG